MKAKMMYRNISLATSHPVRVFSIHCRVGAIAPGPVWKAGEKKK